MQRVENICYYPIKGVAGESLDSTFLTRSGIVGDRQWAFTSPDQDIDRSGNWVRSFAFERLSVRPEMAKWDCKKHIDGVHFRVSDKNIELKKNDTITVDGRQIQLARANYGYWDHADACISIINLSTIESIEQKLGLSLNPERFRANIYIRAEPWSEFSWLGKDIHIGEAILAAIRPIDRCKATSVDPGLGIVENNIPALLTQHYGHMYCGIYASVSTAGLITVNSSVSTNDQLKNQTRVENAVSAITAPPVQQWPRYSKLAKIVEETANVRSLWFEDSLDIYGSWSDYKPGQNVRFHNLDNAGTWRAYTVSGSEAGLFRVTVKRDRGSGSNKMHSLQVGDSVLISGPNGKLTISDEAKSLFIVTAGIGITPAAAMIKDLPANIKTINFIHITRSSELALWPELKCFAQDRDNVHTELFLTDDNVSVAGAQSGRPNFATIAKAIKAEGAHTIICGPQNFSVELLDALKEQAIPAHQIACETFTNTIASVDLKPPSSAGPYTVNFVNSGIKTSWSKKDGTLLELAERHGLIPPTHCRAGICGTCLVSILQGQVEQLAGLETQEPSALLCCAVPSSDLELAM